MVDIISEDCLLETEQRDLIRAAVEATLVSENRKADVAVRIVGLEEIHRLNREFRNVDRPTDVLSFPAWEGEELMRLPDGFLGDIAICFARAKEQAVEYGHSFGRELAFLAVHGTLHLLGYDHMNEADETVMRGRQKEILDGMGQRR